MTSTEGKLTHERSTPEPPLFEARGLGKTYCQGDTAVAALKEVSFQVQAGEFVVVAGPSGCGKSTLLNLLGGLDEADRGQVLFAGQDLAKCSERARTSMRRRQLGFVFQAFNLVPVLSAFENVEYGLWLMGVPKAERRIKVSEALETVGLTDRARRRPSQLSGGERQRIALARALVHEPVSILADEPTASLDSRTGGAIVDLFVRLNARRRTTFILATHDPLIFERAPRRLRLQDGEIVDDLRTGS